VPATAAAGHPIAAVQAELAKKYGPSQGFVIDDPVRRQNGYRYAEIDSQIKPLFYLGWPLWNGKTWQT
jgi:hypothetical protein